MLDLVRPRQRFYSRPWFLAMFTAFLIVLIAGIIWGLIEKQRWEARARAFDYSKMTQMESASIIYDRSGAVMGRIFVQNRDQVSFDEISPHVITAVVAAEDARFYKHRGWDWYGIMRAAVTNLRSKRAKQGASTLTQQLARNTFPSELPPNDRTLERKVLEIFVAREIESRMSKRDILELYLNRVFFGSGFYGVEAAARGYFGKRARDLNLSEGATLAGLLKSPSNLSPWRNRQACIDSRNYVLQRALELKFIDQKEYDETIAQDLIVKNRRPTHQETYAADLVAQQVEKLVGRDAAMSDGYQIYTTIDTALQRSAEKTVREELAKVERRPGYEYPTFSEYDAKYKAWAKRPPGPDGEVEPIAPPDYLQGAVVAVDNSSGAILALVGGRDFQHSEYDRALLARRPPGTAFKPLVYAAGFESGLFPGTVVKDEVLDNRQVMIGGMTGILGEWGPERVDNRYEGAISARDALVKSKNAASVRFGMMIGKDLKDSLSRVQTVAKAAGIESPLREYPSTFLGSSEMTLLELTLSNTIFATGGVRPKSTWIIERIEDQDGQLIYQARPEQVRVLRPTTAYEVHTCLSEVLERGTADRTYNDLGVRKFDLGGKTGTAYNFTDLWFVGYSSAVTCGVWVGFDKPRPIYRGAFSNQIALPIWADVMQATFTNYHPAKIATPAGLLRCEICSSTGLRATPKCVEVIKNGGSGEEISKRTTYFEICTQEQMPKDACDVHGGGIRTNVREVAAGEWPRAALAVDVSTHTPVEMKGPTVIGEYDPYNSLQSLTNAVAAKALAGQVAPMDSSAQVPAPVTPGETIEVRRAEAVRPVEEFATPEVPIKLDPPKPIDF
jgi:1A family penicillin-binding protein